MDEALRNQLEAPPDGPFPGPLTVTAPQELRIAELTPDSFERLCYRLASLSADVEDGRRYGVRGQADSGVDLYTRHADGRYITYQCKRYQAILPSDISDAVDRFLVGKWADTTDRFVLCTSADTTDTRLADEIRRQTRVLRERPKPVSFSVQGRSELSLMLKEHPQIVGDFFGPHVRAQFFPDEQPASNFASAIAAQVADQIGLLVPPRIVVLDWASRSVAADLERLRTSNRQAFDGITQLGAPPTRELVAAIIRAHPHWLAEADGLVWDVVARVAQKAGAWDEAATAWHAAAARQQEDDRIRSLIAGSVAAGVAEDTARERVLMEEAARIAPDHARVQLAAIPEDLSGADLLARLKALRPEHREDRALIAGRMCLACMMIPDLDQAREHLSVIRENTSDSFMQTSLRVNLEIQQARLNVLHGAALDTPSLRHACRNVLEQRETLIEERRWSESSRLLMLAADALALLSERTEAAALLATATDDEIATEEGPIVLGECAMGRALDAKLALRIVAQADQTNPIIRRIRAEALTDVGTIAERREALKTLEDIVDDDGSQAAEAAFFRLSCAIGERPADWHEASYEHLMGTRFARAAVTVRVFYLAQRHSAYDEADQLIGQYLDEMWAKAARVRLALTWRRRSVLTESADDLMSLGPAQAYRLDAGRAYALAGQYKRAQEVLIGVARDPSAPPVIRADAYNQLLRVVGLQLDDWPLARRLHKEWVALSVTDQRHNRFAPVIANRA